VGLVAREVEHRATEDRVEALGREGDLRQIGNLEARRREVRRELSGQALDLAHRLRVLIHPEDLVAVAEKVDQVPAAATARIQKAHARLEAALHHLVEQVDVDRAELLA
jgi:hypothetical protein